MTRTIDSSLLRLVSVRPPRRMTRPRPNVALIRYEIRGSGFIPPDWPIPTPVDQATEIAVETPGAEEGGIIIVRPPVTFYTILAGLRQSGSRAAMEQAVVNFRATAEFIGDRSVFAAEVTLYDDLIRTPGVSSDPELQSLIESALKISIPEYVSSGAAARKRERLFHNLFAAVIVPSDPPLREDLLTALKLEQIIRDVDLRRARHEGEVADSLEPIPMRGIVVLPRAIFPLPDPADDVAPPPVDEAHLHDADAAAEEIRQLQTALGDVERALNRAAPKEPAVPKSAKRLVANVSGSRAALTLQETRTALADRLAIALSSAAHHDKADRTLSVAGMYFSEGSVCVPRTPDLCTPYRGVPMPRKPGRPHAMSVADLLVVRQKLLSYVAGEISHITNVMATETRETRHRHLLRSEETITVERETTRETQRDEQSTERFSLENETKHLIREESALQAGVSLTSQGLVKVTASASYSTTTAQEAASSAASSYAKEVTERALERVTERVREQRTRTTIEEIEENNLHKFENTKGEHIVGVYQWVDKRYESRLYNLGRRLMLQFSIPEPAAFHIYSTAVQQLGSSGASNPIPPETPSPIGALTSASVLDETNYAAFAARYGATDVVAPPPRTVMVGQSFTSPQPAEGGFEKLEKGELTIPTGYVAKKARVLSGWSVGTDTYVRVFVGDLDMTGGHQILPMHDETGKIPVVMQSALTYFLVNVQIECERKEAMEDWKLKTYASILAAYESRRSAYEKTLASDVAMQTLPSERYREIEREELKRASLQELTGQRFDSFHAMQGNGAQGYPEFSNALALSEGRYAQFFEHACDWQNMSYEFFPYFWARKPWWISLRQYETDDPLFTKFLQAGSATVLVPVSRNYEKSILHYLLTGEVWEGEDVPIHDDDLHLSILHDLMETEAEDGETLLSTWEVRVPTTLTILRTEDPTLPDWSGQGL